MRRRRAVPPPLRTAEDRVVGVAFELYQCLIAVGALRCSTCGYHHEPEAPHLDVVAISPDELAWREAAQARRQAAEERWLDETLGARRRQPTAEDTP